MKDDYFDYNVRDRKGVGFFGILAIVVIVALVSGICTYAYLTAKYEKTFTQNNTANQQNVSPNTDNSNNSNENNSAQAGEKYAVNSTAFSAVYNDNCDSVVILKGYVVSDNEEQLYCTGSGFVISEDGYILTNSHIVAKVNKITVEFYDGTVVDSEIIGFDERTEVAVLKAITDNKLKAVKLGDSDKVSVGEYALAIGHPIGYPYSLTVGIVSGVQRSVENNNYTYKMIQIDTAINSGNSGGPLFNIDGEVIGITTMKESSASLTGSTIEGMGFAITINTAKDISDQLIKNGKVSRGAINATVSNEYDSDGNSVGVSVKEIVPGGAAEKAGLQINDVIIEFNGVKITKLSEILAEIDNCSVGDTIDCKVLRNGVQMNIKITLGEL